MDTGGRQPTRPWMPRHASDHDDAHPPAAPPARSTGRASRPDAPQPGHHRSLPAEPPARASAGARTAPAEPAKQTGPRHTQPGAPAQDDATRQAQQRAAAAHAAGRPAQTDGSGVAAASNETASAPGNTAQPAGGAPAAAESADADLSAGNQRAFAAALGPTAPAVAGVHDGHGRPATNRLRIYRNNVIVSLRDALRTTFPATRRLAGAELFDAAAVAYAQRTKPASPLLYRYGSDFPAFIGALPGLSPYPFVAEVAALEYARVAATNAADAAPLTAVSLAAVAPDALASLVLVPHPAAHLLPTPAGGFHAFMRDAGLSTPETPAAACLVTRPQMALMMTPLGAPAAAFLEALNAGTPLGTAAADDGLDLATCLATLLSCGAFKAPA